MAEKSKGFIQKRDVGSLSVTEHFKKIELRVRIKKFLKNKEVCMRRKNAIKRFLKK